MERLYFCTVFRVVKYQVKDKEYVIFIYVSNIFVHNFLDINISYINL